MTLEEAFESADILVQSTDEVLVINPLTRQIQIPTNELLFGVETDKDTERKWFIIPKIVGDEYDVTKTEIRVNYINAIGNRDVYIVDDAEVTDNGDVVFSWKLGENAMAYRGTITFVVCFRILGEEGYVLQDWNTTIAMGKVLAGIEVDDITEKQEFNDLVQQLINAIGGSGGASIDDNTTSTLKTWSSKKINDEFSSVKEDLSALEKEGVSTSSIQNAVNNYLSLNPVSGVDPTKFTVTKNGQTYTLKYNGVTCGTWTDEVGQGGGITEEYLGQVMQTAFEQFGTALDEKVDKTAFEEVGGQIQEAFTDIAGRFQKIQRGNAVVFGDSLFNNDVVGYDFGEWLAENGTFENVYSYAQGGSGFHKAFYPTKSLTELLKRDDVKEAVRNADCIYMNLGGNDIGYISRNQSELYSYDLYDKVKSCFNAIQSLNENVPIYYNLPASMKDIVTNINNTSLGFTNANDVKVYLGLIQLLETAIAESNACVYVTDWDNYQEYSYQRSDSDHPTRTQAYAIFETMLKCGYRSKKVTDVFIDASENLVLNSEMVNEVFRLVKRGLISADSKLVLTTSDSYEGYFSVCDGNIIGNELTFTATFLADTGVSYLGFVFSEGYVDANVYNIQAQKYPLISLADNHA